MFFPGNGGLPEHYHPGYEERFEALEGDFVFIVDAERTTLTEGRTSLSLRRFPIRSGTNRQRLPPRSVNLVQLHVFKMYS